MPKPIRMTDEMIEKSFADVRKTFEEAYEKALSDAKSGKKLADGKFEFKFSPINWSWKDDDDKATLDIETEAYLKIMALVRQSNDEIAWHGIIERDENDDKRFILKDVFLFPQKVTSTTVVTDDDKYAQWVTELPDETFFRMRYHGHSHVNMGVTPSGVDMDYRKDMLGQFNDGFYVFMIINKREDITAQIYDFDNNVLYDDKDIEVTVNENWASRLNDDIEKYVTKYTYGSGSKTTTQASSGGAKIGSSYSWSDDDDPYYGFQPYFDKKLGKLVYPDDPDYIWGN